jgi:DNA polymerase I-like protein with 3'-5' exonuclease and polymerase domains
MIVVPTLHPAYLLRSSEDDKGNAKFSETVIGDFKRASELRHRPPRWNEEEIWWSRPNEKPFPLFPTVHDVKAFVDLALATPGHVSLDVESTGISPMDSRLLCVGLGFFANEREAFEHRDGHHHAKAYAICIPFIRQGDIPYWSESEVKIVVEQLRRLMAKKPVLAQNGSFDTVVMYRWGMPVANWDEDTMQLHHVVDSELPHGLDYLASVNTEIPYWKDATKGDEAWVHKDDLTLRVYNLRDVLTTLRSWVPLLKKCRELHLEHLYRQEIELCKWMASATVRGIAIDYQRRDSVDPNPDQEQNQKDLKRDGKTYPFGLGPRLKIQRDDAAAAMRNVAGSTFNPASPPQLRDLLFKKLKFPIVARSEKSGLPSTDKKAMVLLALHADTPEQRGFLKSLMRWRRVDKLIGTYVDGLPISGDGRLHVSWKNTTNTGRLSSSPNAQNWNSTIKKIFRAGPPIIWSGGAWIPWGQPQRLVSIDLSQAELRVIAYFANDPELLAAYRLGLNVHTANTTLLFQVRNPGADSNPQTEAYLKEACPRLLGVDYESLPVAPDKKIWKRMRRLAKNFVFGSNYGGSDDTIFSTLRAERDPETDEPIFADLQKAQIEAMRLQWFGTLHPALPLWWDRIVELVMTQGHYKSPISGRIRWFRGGMNRNEILNTPVQEAVAGHMMRTNEVCRAVHELTGGEAGPISQVHDALTFETPDRYEQEIGKIMKDVLGRPFPLQGLFEGYPNFADAVLPPDDPTFGVYLDEV